MEYIKYTYTTPFHDQFERNPFCMHNVYMVSIQTARNSISKEDVEQKGNWKLICMSQHHLGNSDCILRSPKCWSQHFQIHEIFHTMQVKHFRRYITGRTEKNISTNQTIFFPQYSRQNDLVAAPVASATRLFGSGKYKLRFCSSNGCEPIYFEKWFIFTITYFMPWKMDIWCCIWNGRKRKKAKDNS